jgi:hypothetical protein
VWRLWVTLRSRPPEEPDPDTAVESEKKVPPMIISHEVDDVEHWLTSPGRAEIAKRMGWTGRTFVDASGSNRVSLADEVPDVEAFFEIMKNPSEELAEAGRVDGVRADTAVVFIER